MRLVTVQYLQLPREWSADSVLLSRPGNGPELGSIGGKNHSETSAYTLRYDDDKVDLVQCTVAGANRYGLIINYLFGTRPSLFKYPFSRVVRGTQKTKLIEIQFYICRICILSHCCSCQASQLFLLIQISIDSHSSVKPYIYVK